MCQKLINLSPDLKRLQEENYDISIKQGHLIVHNIPYVNSEKNICYDGALVSTLTLSGDKTTKPDDHICYFQGEQPCNEDGSVITSIQYSEEKNKLCDDLEVDRSFSNKPQDGYENYYEKIVTYCNIIECQAQAINPSVNAKNNGASPVNSSDNTNRFQYTDTNSSRAGIVQITEKLYNLNIAIIGLGGTGSYILDFVSKTNVKQIHIFDDDKVETHNAFRMPGAVSKETLDNNISKVSYLDQVYSKIRKDIYKYEYKLKDENLKELDLLNLNFVFICIDSSAKKDIIYHLIDLKIPFIDVGIDVQKRNGCLTATARTTIAEGKDGEFDRIKNRINFTDDDDDDIYSSNIQIAEVNAINAVLAIIRWKKWAGIYSNNQQEYNSCYDLSQNKIINDY